MKKRIFSLLLCIAFASVTILPISIQTAHADSWIYINADGSITPSNAPILRSGDHYSLTSDVTGEIVVNKNNITFDGAHHTLSGDMLIDAEQNVAVQNFDFENGNVYVYQENANFTINNNIVVNGSISGNYCSATFDIYGNTITNGTINFARSTDIMIHDNIISNSEDAIVLYDCGFSSVIHNKVTHSLNGLVFEGCYNSTVTENHFANNENGTIVGWGGDQYGPDNWEPRYNIISRNTISANTQYGIYFFGGAFNMVSDNAIKNNQWGICLDNYYAGEVYGGYYACYNNTFSDSTIQSNAIGIQLWNDTSNNLIYQNNFCSNTVQAAVYPGMLSKWDDGYIVGGNYWSNYVGVDSNCDGFGNSPYYINTINIDHYPLMKPYPTLIFKDGFETDNFNRWTGTSLTTGEKASVTNTSYYRGNYNARFTSNGGGRYESAYCYENMTVESELFARGYFYVSQSGISGSNSRFFFIIFKAGNNGLAYAGWKKVNGVTKWCLTMRQGTTYIDVFSSASLALNKWYCVELHWKLGSTNGLAELWVNGVKICSSTAKNTATYGKANVAQFGIAEAYGCGSTTIYSDCCGIGTSRIGTQP